MSDIDFDSGFRALTGNPPFPWQQALYKRFVSNVDENIPACCSLPTGLGKTSVIAIWLIALANYPSKMPRRLVYVVNRRTVVDQTTVEVEKLRRNLLELKELEDLKGRLGGLAISTLRGQFADNREWSANPSRPAVICGTVDMIGSRLLFSGYGVGFKGKPLHAGFLGQDVLLVHDEAHLEPAFQELLIAIEKEQTRCKEFRAFHVMALSATSRGENSVFTLTPEERELDPDRKDAPEPLRTVWTRIMAKKGLQFQFVERSELAKTIGRKALRHRNSGKAVLVFVRTVEDVKTAQGVLCDKKEGVSADQVQVLSGTLRGRERDKLANDAVFKRFLLKAPLEGKTVYLVCTSAGEVGIDISADHMVCDLTPYESMAQRLGRVNRRGDGAAEIDVICESDPDPKKKDDDLEKSRWQTLETLKRLSACNWIGERQEGSPHELSQLMTNLTDEDRRAAFSPLPTILPTSDILFDAWALTTIRDKLPGRPPVADYLHGVSEWELPQTVVAWRREVSEITGELLDRYQPRDLLESYPLKAHELLRDRTDRIFNALEKLAAAPETPVWVLDDDDDEVTVTTLGQLAEATKEAIESKTVLLPPQAGGLGRGLLDESEKYDPSRPDYDVADEWYDTMGQLRVRKWNDDTKPEKMKRVREIVFRNADDEDATPTEVWFWFARNAGENIDAKSTKEYDLQLHLDDAKDAAENFVSKIVLEAGLQGAVILAAKFHDLGKDRKRWQNGIGNETYPVQKWAKSGDRAATSERSRYRHEFGSLSDVTAEVEFKKLKDNPHLQDLVMHLIAAHHGRARPHFDNEEAFDDNHNDDESLSLAAEVPLRFARLQRKYGRWGLAYLESLVRAADIMASRKAEGRD